VWYICFVISLLSGSAAAIIAADPFFVASGFFRIRENPVEFKFRKVVKKSWRKVKGNVWLAEKG
jgi:hypothetical protein